MPRIRVLVVDDSVVTRRVLTDVLSSDPDIEVVGTAPNGSIALSKVSQLNPDLVTLDIEMPDMSGLEVLCELRRRYRTLPIVMFSSLTQRAGEMTLQALSLGASDYVTKPSQVGSLEAAVQHVRAELVPRIHALCLKTAPGPDAAQWSRRPSPGSAGSTPIGIVAVGASTGGPNALSTLFAGVPSTFPVPVVIVQHMPPLFTKLLADRLSASCPLTFSEAREGELLEPGRVWLAPGDTHMRVVSGAAGARIALDQGPPENSCRPSVDVLLRSVAGVYGPATLAIILTGMGQDGLRGCEQIHERAGQILVQDRSTSVVWGMPGFVANAGLAQAMLSPSDLAAELMRRVARASANGAGRPA